jgi:predicted RNase H-like HicB family nuclease
MRYAVVTEKAGGNYSAYVPDLPGCVATGPTVKAVEDELREAIRFHVAGLPCPNRPALRVILKREAITAPGFRGAARRARADRMSIP